MALRFHQALPLLLIIFSFSATSAYTDEDPTIQTMEQFSGYPNHEPPSCISSSASSLSVDTESLQKQIDELSTFSDTPSPSVTRILYSDKDVVARSFRFIHLGRVYLLKGECLLTCCASSFKVSNDCCRSKFPVKREFVIDDPE